MIAALIAALCLCGGAGGPYEPAVRLEPPVVVDIGTPPTLPVPVLWTTQSANSRCIGMEFILAHFSPGWDVVRMSRYAYRESRCQPGANNTAGAQGLLQITRINYAYLRSKGLPVSDQWLRDPVNNVRAAAELWRYSRYSPWDCCV